MTAGAVAGVDTLGGTVAAGCGYETTTTDETSDRQWFVHDVPVVVPYAEVQLTIDGTPSTAWGFEVNESSTSSDACGGSCDHAKTVRSDTTAIDAGEPQDCLGILVDTNGDDLTYDLGVLECA